MAAITPAVPSANNIVDTDRDVPLPVDGRPVTGEPGGVVEVDVEGAPEAGVGVSLIRCVGTSVGSTVGAIVGSIVCAIVGSVVGTIVGSVVGSPVGSGVEAHGVLSTVPENT